MLGFNFIGLVLFLVILGIEIYRLVKKKSSIYEFVFRIMFLVYVLFVVMIVFFPIPYKKEIIEYKKASGLGDIHNFVPFKMISNFLKNTSFRYMLKQIGGNFILLLPLSIFVKLFLKDKKSTRFVFLIGFLSTCFIEITQGVIGLILDFQYRVVDVDDIILNFTGYVVGVFVATKIIQPFCNRFFNNVKNK
ncbi:VanZ family protein [Peptostreptococcaceae bacterium OttesenSCG-928-C18]|nr:VanZ family protein [Peptostreptococcaceae bacterium OttesenSCG-928-C18]